MTRQVRRLSALLLIVAIGCTGSGSDEAEPSADLIRSRYLGYSAAYLEANTGVPDPGDPRLAEYATGPLLEYAGDSTDQNLSDGIALRPRDSDPYVRVTVEEIDAHHAILQDCSVVDDLVVLRDSGQIVQDAIESYLWEVDMKAVDGGWRAERSPLLEQSKGVSRCASGS